MANAAKEPEPEQWYPLTLGSSLTANSSPKLCLLRYEFKPASIDHTRPGTLQKSKENKVTVEYNNNQPGKSKLQFQGNSEDCKDLDAVLFFDGQNFRLEHLHKAVNCLRYIRLPGESASTSAPAAATVGGGGGVAGGAAAENKSPPGTGLGRASKGAAVRSTLNSVPVSIERIDIGEPNSPSPAGKKNGKRSADEMNASSPLFTSPEEKSNEEEEHVDVDGDEDVMQAKRERLSDTQEVNVNIDDDMANDNDSDDEIADVEISDDEADKGPNAAEALRAQVDAEESEKQETSSSSGSSGSGSSGTGSASSSSDSEGSDDDSASSGGDN